MEETRDVYMGEGWERAGRVSSKPSVTVEDDDPGAGAGGGTAGESR